MHPTDDAHHAPGPASTRPPERGDTRPPERGDLVAVLDEVAALGQERTKQGVLERLVDLTRALTGARFGIALLTGPDGRPTAMAHQGMTTAQVTAMPRLPRPLGLLGLVLAGQTLRLEDLRSHGEGVGLPPGHTPMAALLGTPLTHHEDVIGGLYLSHPPGRGHFDARDQALVAALALHAGACLGALRAARQSHELLTAMATSGPDHDVAHHTDAHHTGAHPGISPVVRRLVAAARTTVGLQTTALTRIQGSTQTFVAVDTTDATPRTPHAAHPGMLAEGTTIDVTQGYCGLVLDHTLPATVPDVRAHPLLGPMPVTDALGVGAYCGVPVPLPDGSTYGTLCGLGPDPTEPLSSTQLGALTALAELIGAQIARENHHRADQRNQQQAFAPYLDGQRRATVLQPIVDLATGAPAGYEALTRFTDPAGAPRRPDLVFAEAGRLGLGVQLEQATAAAALSWLPHLPPGRYLSVNLSAQALLHPATRDQLTTAATQTTHQLVVELTEHDHVEDYPALVRVLDELRARGIRLAIDDTGAGYASLQHLTRLHPDIVKLDLTFVRDIDTDPARRAIARALIGLTTEIGAHLVAEGIETPAERNTLTQLGATHGQGYHLARPAPPTDHLPQHPTPPRQRPATEDQHPTTPPTTTTPAPTNRPAPSAPT
ncbi:EAL domain-containing protein [uncultured Pseudokineococcus sp.]|uniref:EAL domain-containing protein n=1 Tax=uncultured Pseudokineococcus sp. TaxID=1642928 RepID=UPI002617F5CD|nr:EAL domain-containing protein [uncultured Pseudokineococcus sp.]